MTGWDAYGGITWSSHTIPEHFPFFYILFFVFVLHSSGGRNGGLVRIMDFLMRIPVLLKPEGLRFLQSVFVDCVICDVVMKMWS